jgi:predicted nuclease of predicted toxin-antitoxin system
VIGLLLDQGLPRRAAADLRARGWVVQHVSDLGLWKASDEEILEYASQQGLVVITHDSDFARLVAVANRAQPSVIHVRIARVTRERLVRLLGGLVPHVEDDLRAGCMVSVDEGGARVRRLPLA